VLLLLACLADDPPAPALPEVTPRPAPVVLITLDTTRADGLGCYGNPASPTPVLDSLADRGARFSRAYAPVPLTIPSHSTLHTGLLPPRHGVRDNGDHRLSEEAVTLAERFAEAGYRTQAVIAAFVTQSSWGFGQGFQRYDEDLGVASDQLSWRVERPADEVIDRALASLPDADFLWVHLFDAHAPYAPPDGFEDFERPYDGELAFMDHQLQRLLSALPVDALIVVVGDHGEAFGEGGESTHGLLLEDGAVRVPLLLVGPGIPPHQVIDRPVSLADVAPTLLRLRGLPPLPVTDGTDLLEPEPRLGVYSETRYGYHHFGWTPLERLTTEAGHLVRGARVERFGALPEGALAELDRLATLEPAFAASRATLDLGTLQQLQALGYVSEPGGVHEGLDPRDGVGITERLDALRRLPLPAQIEGFRALLEEQPGLRDTRMRLGMALLQLGRSDEGLAELTTAYRHSPGSTTAVAIGEVWLQRGDAAEALDWFEEALSHDPRSATAVAGQAQAIALSGQLDQARVLLDEALLSHPDHADLVLASAVLALALGEGELDWLDPVEQVAARRPYQARIFHVLGSLQARAGDFEGAEGSLKTELRMRPGNTAARLDLVALYREQGRLVDVVKTLRPLVALYPEDERWSAMTRAAYLEMGRPDLAEAL
jgi:choline-sulfatase